MKAHKLLIAATTLAARIILSPSGCAQTHLAIELYAGLEITGEVGSVHSVQCTTNISEGIWETLATLMLTNTTTVYLDSASPAKGKRYYRSVSVSPPPYPDPNAWVWIKPGTFLLGSSDSEFGRGPNEGPQTQVTISRPFWMAKRELTQGEFESLMGYNPSFYNGDRVYWIQIGMNMTIVRPRFGLNPDRPAESLRWDEAMTYCARLTERESRAGRLPAGYVYRLPTEAEWEYACRAGTTTRFSYGNDNTLSGLTLYGWFEVNSVGAWPQDTDPVKYIDLRTPHPTGEKAPNTWGLYDMHGGVWEYCLDRYLSRLPGGTLTDPTGPTTGSDRVLRGGSWFDEGSSCRSATRSYGGESGATGFRVVLGPVLP